MSATVSFRLRAKDPNGTFLANDFTAAIIPRVGDTLMLPDGASFQDVTVSEIVLYPAGEVEVWCSGFDGWEKGTVVQIFECIRRAQKRGKG